MKKSNRLTNNELNELKGGVQSADSDELNIDKAVVKNKNKTTFCVCNYSNTGVIKNINKVDGCKCNCNELPIPKPLDQYYNE